ncbi:hypothetical protein C8Q74DRAFT_1202200 [Fomes fomentarius]|nr:hypothetical protein C8Q74DRAFT_1202200 [Fomes fomentarius]
MQGSISERLYIRWLPDESTEPTSTLVLSSVSVDKRFVDLRLLKPSDPSAGYTTLEWGIGGRSVGTSPHGKWIHDIDSRTMNPEPDEGDMSPHPTLPGVTIERGTMRHPESGELREYEEAWKKISVLPVKCGGPHDGKIVTVFLESGGAGTARWGMICRVGQYVQGIVRDGQSVSVQRWAWLEGQREWKNVAQIGDASMVCDVTWKESLQGIDTTFTRDGYTWRKISSAVAGHGQGGSHILTEISDTMIQQKFRLVVDADARWSPHSSRRSFASSSSQSHKSLNPLRHCVEALPDEDRANISIH